MPLRRVTAGLAASTRVAIISLAGVMLAALSLQVFSRFVLGRALAWSEELALGCFTWCTLLSIALGVREAIHVRMDTLADTFSPAVGVPLTRAIYCAIAAFGSLLAWVGVRYVLDAWGTTSAAIGYPIAWLYAAAPVCGLLLTVFALERALIPAANWLPLAPPDAAPLPPTR